MAKQNNESGRKNKKINAAEERTSISAVKNFKGKVILS